VSEGLTMVELETSAPSGDELQLARLGCAKLAKLVQGALSIGLPALETGVPDPRVFFADRFRVLTAFALVLHSASGRNTQETLRLRAVSTKLLKVLEDLHGQLDASRNSSKPVHSTLGPVRQSATIVCDTINEFATLVLLDPGPIEMMKAVVVKTFAGMEHLESLQASLPK
jgi:hypothetical protein